MTIYPESIHQIIQTVNEKIDAENPDHKQEIINGLQDYLSSGKKLVAKNLVPLAPEIPVKGYPRCKKWMIIENTSIESDL